MAYTIMSAFLDEHSLRKFLQHWPERCVYSHGQIERLPALCKSLSLSSIERITQDYAGTVMECDSRRDSSMWTADGGGVSAVIERGTTAVLSDVAPLLEGAGQFISDLEMELGIQPGSVRISAFVSAAGNGARCHYDAYDVISVQLVGNKRFYTSPVKELRYPYGYQYNPDMPPADDFLPQITNGFPDFNDQEFERIDMRPGSVLCMPRGTWHHTCADSDSLAISIVLSPKTEMDRLLEQLTATLLQSEAWRTPCYGLRGVSRDNYSGIVEIIKDLVERENNPDIPSRSFGEQSRYISDPSAQITVSKKGDLFEAVLAGHPAREKSISARIEVSQRELDVFYWLLEQSGSFTVAQAMRVFPGRPLEYFHQIFSVASKAGLTHYLWFDPVN